MGQIIGTIIFGAVIGILARLVLPGKQQYGMIITVVLGVAGALIGYWVWGAYLGQGRHGWNRLDPLDHQHRRGGRALDRLQRRHGQEIASQRNSRSAPSRSSGGRTFGLPWLSDPSCERTALSSPQMRRKARSLRGRVAVNSERPSLKMKRLEELRRQILLEDFVIGMR